MVVCTFPDSDEMVLRPSDGVGSKKDFIDIPEASEFEG